MSFELDLERGLDAVPDQPGVLLLEFAAGTAYACRTARLSRRLRGLLGTAGAGRRLFVQEALVRVRYEPTGSAFESSLTLYGVARRIWPDAYRRRLRLRPPPLLKAHLGNPYPRTSVTTRPAGGRALFFGPFVNRTAAERFEEAFLDLFLIRRCVENIEPSPDHPGCIYGEMKMCLRPCQAAVGVEEYRREAGRGVEFLATRGQSLVREIERARDEASEGLDFEEAGLRHKRLEKVRELLRATDELARELDSLHGAVVQRSSDAGAIELRPLFQGVFQDKIRVPLEWRDARPGSLDRRVREALEGAEFRAGAPRERADHLALLARWYYSSWRRGEIVLFDRLDRIPIRRLVNAISRVAQGRERRA